MNNNSCTYSLLAIFSAALLLYTDSLIAQETRSASNSPCELTLSLEEFRAHAFAHSPLIAEIDRDYATDVERAFETETLSNPELHAEQTYTREKRTIADDRQLQVVAAQPLRLSHFGTRERVASLIKKSGAVQKKARLLELSQKLTIQYTTLQLIQQSDKILAAAELRAVDKVLLIRDGVKKGLLTQGDEKIFEGERFRLQAQRKGLAANSFVLQNELGNTIGTHCTIFVAGSVKGSEQLPEIPSEESLLDKAGRSELSESTRQSLLFDLAKEQSRLAELDAFPEFTPRLVYEHTNDGADYIGAGISIALPLWNRNQGNRIRTKAEQHVGEVKTQLLAQGGIQTQIRNLRNAAVSAAEQAEIYSTKAAPAFEAALQAQEKLYAQGKGNVLQVWQMLRSTNEVQTQTISLWLQAALSRAQLSLLIGEEI